MNHGTGMSRRHEVSVESWEPAALTPCELFLSETIAGDDSLLSRGISTPVCVACLLKGGVFLDIYIYNALSLINSWFIFALQHYF